MRKQMIWTLCFFIVLCLISASAYVALSGPHIQTSSYCTSYNRYSKCSINLVSDARLPRPFDWKVAVQPSNIQLGVSSGTLTRGGRNEIQFQVPHQQCPVTMIFTGSDGSMIKSGSIRC